MKKAKVIDFISHPVRVNDVVEKAAAKGGWDAIMMIARDPHFEKLGRESLLDFSQRKRLSKGWRRHLRRIKAST